MRKLCRVDLGRREEIFAKLEKYVAIVAEKLRPRTVILFGSFARGDIHEGSDVDVVVIADFQEPFLDRIKLLLDFNEGIGLPLEPVGYTPKEFQDMLDKGNRFAQEVLRTGKVLFGTWPLGEDISGLED